MIEEFKKTQDFKDICYMIDHIDYLPARIDVLEKLGYKLGVVVVKDDSLIKNVIKSKNSNNLRVQVTPKVKNINYARCVIIEKL